MSEMDKKKNQKRNTRKLRDRKERKLYTDDWVGEADDEIEGPQSFDLDEKLKSDKFDRPVVKEMKGHEFNLAYIQRHGFVTPLLFRDKAGLGIRIPSDFTVGDVKTCVGSKRLLDVMDVRTQKNFELTMKDWQTYYDNTDRDRLLNVISLEFSHTKLENYVESPTVVRQLDWVDRVWPKHLKNLQTEATNAMDEMMYPKVQKYCLMSVKGCYTDFHVDFGGTSVWYHILKGAKVFWLIPPTEKNLDLYQQWVLSGKQGDTFFGDNVDECGRVYLQGGDTFFIPSGWIHAVYTPADSLVFGGNFLHSFGIEKQLRIAGVEEATKVPQKFRYPFFTEMLWYTLERYVHCLFGKSLIKMPDDDEALSDTTPKTEQKLLVPQEVHLSPHELLGLKAIVLYLAHLPISRKNVPALIPDPVGLLREVRKIVEEHRHDIPDKAVTGKPILVWPGERPEDVGKVQGPRRRRPQLKQGVNGTNKQANGPHQQQENEPKKRLRCGRCLSCLTREDCKQCFVCASPKLQRDKLGGPRLCQMRECLMPILPYDSVCYICGRDGWGEVPVHSAGSIPLKARVSHSNLMECSTCSQISHPVCTAVKTHTRGSVNEDMPSSWECPLCIEKTEGFRNSKQKSDSHRTSESGNNALANSIKTGQENSDVVLPKIENVELNTNHAEEENNKKKLIDRKVREDEAHVQQKMAQAVRRKSVEDGLEKSKKAKLDTSKSTSNVENGKTTDSKSQGVTSEAAGEKNGLKSESEDESESDEESSDAHKPQLKHPFRTDLSVKIMNGSAKSLKRPFQIVRPATVDEGKTSKKKKKIDPIKDNKTITHIFKHLDIKSLNRCLQVCKDWNRFGMNPCLWQHVSLKHQKMTAELLKGVVRRQPISLTLDWTTVSKQQLVWFLNRLPQIQELSLQGVPWTSVCALKTCVCPLLTSLNLGYIGGLTDGALREVLAPAHDARPGANDGKSRLKQLRSLNLAGSHVSDVALRYVTQHAGSISKLDLSTCSRITDAGIAQLGAPDSPCLENLTHLNISGCPQLTNISLDHLRRCRNLKFLDIRSIPGISGSGVTKFLSSINSGASGARITIECDHKLYMPVDLIMNRPPAPHQPLGPPPPVAQMNSHPGTATNSPYKFGIHPI